MLRLLHTCRLTVPGRENVRSCDRRRRGLALVSTLFRTLILGLGPAKSSARLLLPKTTLRFEQELFGYTLAAVAAANQLQPQRLGSLFSFIHAGHRRPLEPTCHDGLRLALTFQLTSTALSGGTRKAEPSASSAVDTASLNPDEGLLETLHSRPSTSPRPKRYLTSKTTQ